MTDRSRRALSLQVTMGQFESPGGYLSLHDCDWPRARADTSPRHRTRIARTKSAAGRRTCVVEEKPRFDIPQHANATPVEHRIDARRRSLKGGKIVLNQRSSVISCSI